MTSDEFQRIVVALCAMTNYNIGGEPYVSLPRVLAIIHSQLHPDDKAKWQFDPQKMYWHHVSDEESGGEMPRSDV